MLDVKQMDEISGHEIVGHENARHENYNNSVCRACLSRYVVPRIIQTISEQNLQWLVMTKSYERFYILPRIVPTHFAIYIGSDNLIYRHGVNKITIINRDNCNNNVCRACLTFSCPSISCLQFRPFVSRPAFSIIPLVTHR